MSTAQIQALGELQTHQRRPAGDLLFCEGDEPAGIYFLEFGTIDLVFSGRNGNVKSLRTAEHGQILGLSSVVMGHVHDCSAMTRTECSVRFMARDDFMRALEEKPGLWFSVLSILSRDVNAVYDDMRALAARAVSSSDAR